jgi:hypothetical protein
MALFAVFILQHIFMIMFTILSFPNTTFDDTCTAIEAGPYATGIGYDQTYLLPCEVLSLMLLLPLAQATPDSLRQYHTRPHIL